MHAGITGNLTKEPQVSETEKGTVARFVVATSPRWRDKDGAWQSGETVFARVEWWGPRAVAFAAEARQGSAVVVVGEWRAQSWTDQGSGEKRRRQYIAAEAAGVVINAVADSTSPAAAATEPVAVGPDEPEKLTPKRQPVVGDDDDFWGES